MQNDASTIGFCKAAITQNWAFLRTTLWGCGRTFQGSPLTLSTDSSSILKNHPSTPKTWYQASWRNQTKYPTTNPVVTSIISLKILDRSVYSRPESSPICFQVGTWLVMSMQCQDTALSWDFWRLARIQAPAIWHVDWEIKTMTGQKRHLTLCVLATLPLSSDRWDMCMLIYIVWFGDLPGDLELALQVWFWPRSINFRWKGHLEFVLLMMIIIWEYRTSQSHDTSPSYDHILWHVHIPLHPGETMPRCAPDNPPL